MCRETRTALAEAAQTFFVQSEALILQNLRANDRLLEVGCGCGLLLKQVLDQAAVAEAVGIDNDMAALRCARALNLGHRVSLRRIDGEDFAALSAMGKFDAVLLRNVLHHFRNPIDAVVNLRTLLRYRGRLLVMDVDRESGAGDWYAFPIPLVVNLSFTVGVAGVSRTLRALRQILQWRKQVQRHRSADRLQRQKIGWYTWLEIQSQLRAAFADARIGRVGSWCGLGGLHYLIWVKQV